MIPFEQIIENNEYRERVIKYFRLPIRVTVSKEKFLSDLEFIKETNPILHRVVIELTEADFNQLVKEQGTTEPDFTYESILQPIVDEFASTEQWQNFLKEDYSNPLGDYDGAVSVSQFYKEENDNKNFLSIDLVSANWQTLQSIIGFKESYEELIEKHTNLLIPQMSKTMRTKITGMLNAKEVMEYNKHLLATNREKILEVIKTEIGLDLLAIKPTAFYADEFITEISEEQLKKLERTDLDKLEKTIKNAVGISVHLRPFKLRWLGVEKACAKFHLYGFDILNLSKDVSLILNKVLHNEKAKENPFLQPVEVNDIDFEKVRLKGQSKEDYLEELAEKVQILL